jgi:hypothetical protein
MYIERKKDAAAAAGRVNICCDLKNISETFNHIFIYLLRVLSEDRMRRIKGNY